MKWKIQRQIIIMSKYVVIGLFIQCLLAGMLLANTSVGQHKSLEEIYVKVDWKNVKVKEAFSSLNSLAGFSFTYFETGLNTEQSISLKSKKISLAEVLRTISVEANLHFKRVNSKIYVKRKDGSFDRAIEEIILDQNQQKVTGTVTSAEDGEPLPGVSILIKGTQSGTTTDFNGNYALEVPDGEDVLVFSFIGFQSKEIFVNNQSIINIALDPDLEQLEEVVVIGYGTAKKKDLTGAIASVDLEPTRTVPNVNPVQSLRGRVAGVVVTDNGRPGSDASIQIRGRNSISASNEPLIVLDGIIYTGGRLSDINPGDIESIHVLKDASSTAVYGSLAANGVIEVTTKKGKLGAPRVSLNTYYGKSDYAHIPDYLDANQYLRVRKDAEIADGGPVPFQPIELENMAAGKSIEPFEAIRQNAPMYNGELSISGKTDKVTYYMSGSYTNSKSPVYGDNFSRISGRLNLDANVTEWLKIGMNTGYSVRDNSGFRASLEHTTYLSPYASLYYEDGVPRPQPMDIGLVGNPLFGSIQNDNQRKQKTLFVNLYTDIQLPVEGLFYRLNTGYTQRNDTDFQYRPSFDRDAFFNLGSGSKNYYEAQNFTLENIIKYSKLIGTDHEINATFLYGIYELKDENSYLSSNNIFNDALGWNSLEIGENFNIDTGAGQSQQSSVMGRLGYRYKGRYIIDFSLRQDGYSAFGPGNKYGTFPAVGMSWNMIEEEFLANSGFIDNLKLRISWGKNGNRGVSRYSSLSNVDRVNYVFGDGGSTSVGLYPSSMANPNLGWETTTSTNIGVDFGILTNRITGSIDIYKSITTDLLLRQTIPNTNGYETFLRNIGETENKGIEISLNTVNIQAGEFMWSSNFAFSHNRNKIVKLTGRDIDGDGVEDDDIASNWFIGHPLGSNYDYVFDGIYQEGDDVSAIPGAEPGHIRFKDLDGDGIITPEDRTVLHSNQPDFNLGFTNTFSYKGFTLMALLTIRQGGYSPNSTLNPGTNFYDQANILDVPYWTPENPINTHPAINYKNPLGYRFYQGRNYVRLQDISLSYSLASSVIEKVKLQGLQLYVSGKNLFTWTDWMGWDPEFGSGSRNPGNNGPLLKTFTVGLSIQF
ncbi:SusC/RagA family TonB-linked outer membrane protein [Flexithrix dorotheae]|uniref:SusC/RagA family TonB-linked outer membrane protein n=1 Tax=Flexithrix dorotheae TaxID=70993 RepID=UPI00035E8112|nr:TonB-dependent receptor [Flexithrix dorotheae]